MDKTVPMVAAESVIVDETALLAKSARVAGKGRLKAVLAYAVTGLQVLALIDTLLMLIELSHAWLTYEKGGAGSEGAQVAHVMTLLHKNEADIQAAFKAHASEAEEITNDHPELNVYANVELVIMETWKTKVDSVWDTEPYDRKLSDITFKALAVSIYPSSKKKILWDRQSSFSQAVADGFTQHVRYTLMTYPVEITFGETPQQRQQRTFAHRIVNAVKKRQSARIVAGSHLGAAPSARPQKGGVFEKPPQSDLEARKQYVRQYIEYTALYGPDDLYLDAIAYLKELEAEWVPLSERPESKPVPGSLGFNLLSDQEKRDLIKYLKSI